MSGLKVIFARLLFCLLILILLSPICRAQGPVTAHVIHLKNADLAAPQNASQWLDSASHVTGAQEPVQALIHFSALPTAADRDQLARAGIILLDYVPDNTFVALISLPADPGAVTGMPVYSIIGAQPEWKASNYMWKNFAASPAARDILVSFYPGIDAGAIRRCIRDAGGEPESGAMEAHGIYKVRIAGNRIRSLAQWYGVKFISPAGEMVPLDLQSRPAVKGNVAVTPPVFGGYGLLGDSVTVGVGDNTSGIFHADLKDRITNFNPAPITHHGEHVNGIVGGAANIDPLAASMAPHVSLVDYLYDLILPATGAMYRDYHMTVTNNSYEVIAGDCDYAGVYDVYSQYLDTLAVQYPGVLHVFASGNDGYRTCSPYLPGFMTVGGGYQPAKNIIVVGSMTDYLDQASDESRGPVRDGRLKPELVATGLGAYSTIGVDEYEWAAGTSMASPQVVGGLAVLTQRFKQLHDGATPRADLLKAIALNGAMDIGNPGPDYSYGFGVLDINRSLKIIDSSRFVSDSITNLAAKTFNIAVPANTAQLRVMLYWNDVPASPASAKQLVNDLDLSVTDPAAALHLPLVLDPSPANVNLNATEQADHLNNVEQVVVSNPAAGTYNIATKGYSVPYGPQRYVVAWDMVPAGIRLTYPLGGEQLSDIDSIRIFWDAIDDGHAYTAQFSQDDGVSWYTISNNIAHDQKHAAFLPANISSGKCLVRLSRNGTSDVSVSQRFVINDQPVLHVDTAQCPGYLGVHWSPVLNASGYYLLRKTGFYMQVVDSTSDTSYIFRSLPVDTKSYVSVQPIIHGLPGYRSVAADTVADFGNCSGGVSIGDIAIWQVAGPSSGRMYTSTQLKPVDTLRLQLRDLYQSPCVHYSISWQVNGGLWQTVSGPAPVPAKGMVTVKVPGLQLGVPGTYNIVAAVQNLDALDPQPLNDTVRFTVRNIANDSLDLSTPFADGYESLPILSLSHDSIGMSPNGYWDFATDNDSGRVRSFVSDEITISGSRSVSLDENQNVPSGSMNRFTGTFNLGRYDTATAEVRFDFDYIFHGKPGSIDGNQVFVRAADTLPPMVAYTYDLSGYAGTLVHAHSVSLTDLLRAAGRNFSSSCQVSFGQNDTSLIAAVNYGNGMTIDNFRLYTVANDAELAAIISPAPGSCGLPAAQPLTVRVHNGVTNTLYNIHLFYTVDSGAVFTGLLDSIKGKSDLNFTFPQQLDLPPGSSHVVNVWLSVGGDTYPGNDSILNYNVRNSKVISSYPYLQNFEQGDGGYYSAGFRNSWQYGTPASPKIHRAASGSHAWKTNLTGLYNNLELSYLYGPCFDISALKNPTLSFSMASDIENCGSDLCDAGYIEISFDGTTWLKLGAHGQGTNWYDSTFNIWNTEGFTRWHVATIPLPQPGPGVYLHFRFVLSADPGATFEGMAIDDVHIYDLSDSIYRGLTTQQVVQPATGTSWVEYTAGNELIGSFNAMGQNIQGLGFTVYPHDTIVNPGATQYTFARSYTVLCPGNAGQNASIRLYLTDSEVVQVVDDVSYPSCDPVTDAYTLGITRYANSNNPAALNGTLADDTGGVFSFIPFSNVQWVPFDKGYYAEISSLPGAEYWFNHGGPTGNFPAGIDYLNFTAFRTGSAVTASWLSLIDTSVVAYAPERSADGEHFTALYDVVPHDLPRAFYSIQDSVDFSQTPSYYYRLAYSLPGNDSLLYSPVRRVDSTGYAGSFLSFDAHMVNHESVLTHWYSFLDGTADQYILDRSIGSAPFTTINVRPAVGHYGQEYYFADRIIANLFTGTVIHYRLTAIQKSGDTIVLPVRDLEWINGNAIVNIFPNPTHDGSFTIVWHADTGASMHIALYDLLGRMISEQDYRSNGWDNTTEIPAMDRPKGLYLLRIDIGGRKYVARMVFQ